MFRAGSVLGGPSFCTQGQTRQAPGWIVQGRVENLGFLSPDPACFPLWVSQSRLFQSCSFIATAIKLWTFAPEQHIKYPIICLLT